jgi:hypothetical protein
VDINQQQHIDKLLWQCAMGKQQQQQAAYPCHKPASHLPVLIEQLELSTSSKSSSRRGYASPFLAALPSCLLLLSSVLQALMPHCVHSRWLAMHWQD